MIILGLDPGLAATGWGVIEASGNRLRHVAHGTVRTTTAAPLAERLVALYDGLMDVIVEYRAEAAAVEEVFVNVNPQSTLLLGQARGAAISAAVIRNLIVAEYTALQVKQAVVGNGHAQKGQVQEMVKRLLSLPATPKPDSADALACAICHAHGGQGLGRLATAGFRVKGGRLI